MFLGVEAIDEEGLRRHRKRVSLGKSFEAIEYARSLGIMVAVNIIADPDWDEARFQAVREWALSVPEIVHLTVNTPYSRLKSGPASKSARAETPSDAWQASRRLVRGPPQHAAHLHFLIYKPGFKTHVSQIYVKDDPLEVDETRRQAHASGMHAEGQGHGGSLIDPRRHGAGRVAPRATQESRAPCARPA